MPRKTRKTERAPEVVEVKIKRDNIKVSNATIAKMIRNREIDPDNWEYIVRRKGYNVKAIKILLGDE